MGVNEKVNAVLLWLRSHSPTNESWYWTICGCFIDFRISTSLFAMALSASLAFLMSTIWNILINTLGGHLQLKKSYMSEGYRYWPGIGQYCGYLCTGYPFIQSSYFDSIYAYINHVCCECEPTLPGFELLKVSEILALHWLFLILPALMWTSKFAAPCRQYQLIICSLLTAHTRRKYPSELSRCILPSTIWLIWFWFAVSQTTRWLWLIKLGQCKIAKHFHSMLGQTMSCPRESHYWRSILTFKTHFCAVLLSS